MFHFFFRKTKAKNGKVLNIDGVPTKDIHLTGGKGESEGYILISAKGGLYIPNILPDITQHLEINKTTVNNDKTANNINQSTIDTINKLIEVVSNLAQTLQQSTTDPVAGNGAPWGSPTINSKVPSILVNLKTIKSNDIAKIESNIKKLNENYSNDIKELDNLKQELK